MFSWNNLTMLRMIEECRYY